MKHSIGQTRNGIAVYVDLITSDAAKHIAQQPHVLTLVAEAIQHITLRSAVAQIERDMGRIIGYNFVIQTTGPDGVFYAQLVRDATYTRFVKHGKPLPTTYLSMLLQRDKDGAYELNDAWIGHVSPPRPGAVNETAESKSYWSNHALILDGQPMQLQTVTKVCPY